MIICRVNSTGCFFSSSRYIVAQTTSVFKEEINPAETETVKENGIPCAFKAENFSTMNNEI